MTTNAYLKTRTWLMSLCCMLVSAVPISAFAVLNDSCVVSVLNRTVQVKADGTWVLPNIPANFGPVRARATCVSDGITQSGQSDFFTIPANGSVDVPKIVLGPVTPIPSQVTVTASSTTLTQTGQTTSLKVIGKYADNTTKDVTAKTTGTQYLISNPALATVSADGLVTAKQSGTVVVQAIQEGTQGLLQINVALSKDSDGDGILDDVELRLGLDPNNPADALDDLDRDGLTNKDEIQRGTDIRNPDTDGDGLKDGDEVKRGTSPVLADTDGDGVPDGIEVASGSNPLDKTSFDLAKSLKKISITPANFVLNVNSISLNASQQLKVLGEFKQGGTIDLTAKIRGSNYASSKVETCNFDSVDGRVNAGTDGACIITVTNSGFKATAAGVVKTFTPKALSYVPIPGFANNVDVKGNYAFVAAGSTGMQVVDVTDKLNPKVISTAALDTPGNANDIAVVGNYAYIADGSSGLQIINISNPLKPNLVGTFDTAGTAWDVVVSNGYAFVADGESGLKIINVSTPSSPSQMGSLAITGTSKGVDIDWNRKLAVVVGSYGVQTVNIVKLTAPVGLGVLSGGDVRDVAINGNSVFLADFSRSFTVVDITKPAVPVLGVSTSQDLGGFLNDVVLSGNFALGADVKFVNGIPIIDVSDPVNPNPRAILDFRAFNDYNGYGLAVDSSFVYLVAGSDYTAENGATGDTYLYIGQYLAFEDRLGVPPTVSISAPKEGDTVIQGQQLTITANATDDIAVAGVTFDVNGVDVAADTTAPFETTYAVPANASNLKITATAIDLGGNTSLSTSVNVTAIPDPLTTITGTVVDSKGKALLGASVTCLTVTAKTAVNGKFTIAGMPTINGDIRCTASFKDGSNNLTGVSNGVAPVRAGTTDVGKITVQAGLSKGRDFWFAHQQIYDKGAQLIILSDENTSFKISSANFNYSGTVSAQSPALVDLPDSLQITSNQVIENKGIHITSDVDVTALLYFTTQSSNDIALLIPTQSLGKEYLVVGYTAGYQSSEFVLAANQDGTKISFVPSCGSQAKQVVNIILNSNQSYQYQCASGDVTGTLVNSDKPLGVFGGASCTNVPTNVYYCDVLSEMLLPTSNYGTEFYAAPLPGNGFDVFRIIASEDGTTVTVDQGGTNNTYTLNRGQFQELQIKSSIHFTSTQPVSVTQYAIGSSSAGIGDPFQMQLVPTSINKNSFRFYTPSDYNQGAYAIITAPNSAVSSVILNGVAVTGFQALPGGTQQYVVVKVPDGQSTISATQPIAVYSIGYYDFGSYGYPAGF